MMLRTLWRKIVVPVHQPMLRSALGMGVMALSFGYLGYLLVRNWNNLATYEWHIDYMQMALAFLYYSTALTFAVLGWSSIMSRVTQATSLQRHLKYYVYTNLFRRLPAPLLYLLGRTYLYEQEGIPKSVTVTTSLLEWILVTLSGLIVYLSTLPFLSLPSPWRSPLIPLGGLVIGTLLVHPQAIRSILRVLGQGEIPVSFGYNHILVWTISYGLVWIGGGLVLYAIINSVYALPSNHLPTIVGIWVLSGLVTILAFATSAGFGLKELTLGLLLSHLIPSPMAAVVALLTRLYVILFEIIWGVVALRL